MAQARVDVWQCDGLGLYSGYARQATASAEGETFLRGTQLAGPDGLARFATIYPGWYPGRTPHIHFKVLLGEQGSETSVVTGQLYFPDPVSERVYATASPYRERRGERDTFNSNDFVFQREGGADTVCDVTEEGGTYRATLVIGIDRGSRETLPSGPQLAHVDVDVEIDVLNAALLRLVGSAFAPRTVAQRGILDPREVEASPFTAAGQGAAAFTAELISQYLLLAARMAYDHRAELAVIALIGAGDPLLAEDRLAKELIGLAR